MKQKHELNVREANYMEQGIAGAWCGSRVIQEFGAFYLET